MLLWIILAVVAVFLLWLIFKPRRSRRYGSGGSSSAIGDVFDAIGDGLDAFD